MRIEGRKNKRGTAEWEGWPGQERKGVKRTSVARMAGLCMEEEGKGKGSPNPSWRVQGRGVPASVLIC